jgi:hypothetical protein
VAGEGDQVQLAEVQRNKSGAVGGIDEDWSVEASCEPGELPDGEQLAGDAAGVGCD